MATVHRCDLYAGGDLSPVRPPAGAHLSQSGKVSPQPPDARDAPAQPGRPSSYVDRLARTIHERAHDGRTGDTASGGVGSVDPCPARPSEAACASAVLE